ncbi:hypothetical protein [Notoacmeibacter sp. MSK16QG-6]|uniref:hypothetical protein n=1 Tax=Notoacmeibacter sp. MSK16QG-6 TaxID=2957982 RepID=UPI00209FB19E|nr:hypothetical protein [Notoacmeibacter sp. MSK16QG-6]MCP1198250.1 hypothetical protein [Notoacmeibacter sp. MSK16QG-6]
MTYRPIAAFTCAAALALGAAASHAQTETGPGGYVYEYKSPSIMLVKPEGWQPPEAEVPEPALLRPIMPTDLYEDEDLAQVGSLDDVIGRPNENALGPVLAAQRAEERQRRIASQQQSGDDANRLAETTTPLPEEGVDRQTTAALPDEDEAAQDGVAVENGVDVIRGDSAASPMASEKPSMSELIDKQAEPAIVEVEKTEEPDEQAARSEPEFSGMEMRF